MKLTSTLLPSAVLIALLPWAAHASSGGITDFSGKTAGQVCTSCHSVTSGTAPLVAITGPSTLDVGQRATYTMTVTGGPGVRAGINVAVSAGTLAAGAGTGLFDGEIHHAAAQTMSGTPAVATFQFSFTAPATAGTVTVFGAGNSCNGANGTSGDRMAATTLAIAVRANNAAPTVATAPRSSQSPVTAKTTTLSVLGADNGGEGALTYSWSSTAGPAAVTFSANNSNAAKSTVATFTSAGAYTFAVLIRDAEGLSVSQSLTLNVSPTLTSITLDPASTGVAVNQTRQFTATGLDQFDAVLSTAPTFTWSTSGGGTISASGLFTAGASAGGPFTITAASGGRTSTAQLTVSNGTPPQVQTVAAVDQNPVTTKVARLTVLGADEGGETALRYTWTAVSPPAAVTFSPNGTNEAKATTATFTRPGTYPMSVTIRDAAGLTVTSTVTVTVAATIDRLTVTPASATIGPNATKQYAITAVDQFGLALAPAPAVAWSTSGGSISTSGLFRSGAAQAGTYAITANTGSRSATAAVTIAAVGTPAIVEDPTASPAVVIGRSTLLSVEGSEAGLRYTWSGSGPGSVTFSDNGTTTAKRSVASFSKAGVYRLVVVLEASSGQTTSAALDLTVEQSLSAVVLEPRSVSVAAGAAQRFEANALDQFGEPMVQVAPSAWQSTGGTIDEAGTLTAWQSPGAVYVVSATIEGIRGTAMVAVGEPAVVAPVAPSVRLNLENDTVWRGTVTLSASASAAARIVEVSFLVDSRVVGKATTPPFELTFDSGQLSNGLHDVEAIATDARGIDARSPLLTVEVRNVVSVSGDLGCSMVGLGPLGLALVLLAGCRRSSRSPKAS